MINSNNAKEGKKLEALASNSEQDAERAALTRVSETQLEVLQNEDVGILGESMADALGYELVENDDGEEDIALFDRDAEEIFDVEES